MAFIPDAVKNALDNAVGRVQGEIGRFLILKERIQTLPAGLTRSDLLAQQSALERTSMKLISEGQALKSELEGFNPFDIKQIASLGPKMKRAADLTLDGKALVEAIQAHKARVISEVGSSADLPPMPTSPSPTRGRLVQGAVLAAVVLLPLGFLLAPGLAVYLKGRRR